jgi:hypothetical protein
MIRPIVNCTIHLADGTTIDLADGTTTHRLGRWYYDSSTSSIVRPHGGRTYQLGRLYDLSTWLMVRPMTRTMLRPMDLADGTIYQLGRGYDLSAWWMIRPITRTMVRLIHASDLSTWSMARPIDLVNVATHRLRGGYDLMVGPIHLVDGTTYRLGRWYDRSTRPMIRPVDAVRPEAVHLGLVHPVDSDDGATHPFGRWYLLSTRTVIRLRCTWSIVRSWEMMNSVSAAVRC